MTAATAPVSDYMKLYKYLSVLDNDQVWKLRKIAIGILNMSAFSPEEIDVLESKLLPESQQR
jgi:hypothetical protein